MSPAVLLTHHRYQPGAILGKGGQGTVLRVVDREDPERELVAKIYRRGAATIPGEFALLSRSRLPGLVRAHDLATDERSGAPFLVEDFVGGVDARGWLGAATGHERSERLASLLAQVATTLGALHDLGFVHGDLKPAHVRFSPAGKATLLDLGSAVLAATPEAPSDEWATTRAYAAPEILAGGRPTPRSDLYGLGALAWTCCTGEVLGPKARRSLREQAPWVVPSLADLVERLVAIHPQDRPGGAREILAALGTSQVAAFAGDARLAPMGRENLFQRLLEPASERVRYVVGPGGSGKSHLARALVTAALLRGEAARIITFSDDRLPPLDDWLALWRGDAAHLPANLARERVTLLVLDDLHRAPVEVHSALDLYRCRPSETGASVVAMAREAPAGATSLPLEPLDDARMIDLLRSLGVSDDRALADLVRSSQGSPGVAVAWLGRVPLDKGAVLERTKGLSPSARAALAALAVAGGALVESTLRGVRDVTDASLAELLESALVTRSSGVAEIGNSSRVETTYALSASHVAGDLAEAIADFETVDAVASAVLASPSPTVASLVALSTAAHPPTRRTDLLHLGAARAKEAGLRESEMDLLFSLAADPRERTRDVLMRLERLTRDTGRTALHPEVLGWLAQAANDDSALAPLALRRQAEAKARAGEYAEATQLVDAAKTAAARQRDGVGSALCLATAGAVALYRADWGAAESALSEARRALCLGQASMAGCDDQEELARLDHNFGVVALYRGHSLDAYEAFARSLATKRSLGDRAGIRACLLNLGITLAKLDRLDEADSALREAVALAEALGQKAGRGWCLAARADVEVRRKNPAAAERFIAEAEALGDAIPGAVRADLAVLRASVSLLEGDGAAAIAALAKIDPALRESDALVDARAATLEARAHLALLPVDRRRAARLALGAIRRARTAELPEAEADGMAALASARYDRAVVVTPAASRDDSATAAKGEDATWEWMASVGTGVSVSDAAFHLARLAVQQARAERGFVALVDEEARVVGAWGADIDGLPVAEADQRLAADALQTALRKSGPSYYRGLETALGVGSRMAVAGGKGAIRGVVIVEHRSRADGFDTISAVTTQRWGVLASLLGRLWQEAPSENQTSAAESVARYSTPVLRAAAEPTTSLPLRAPRRSFPAILGDSRALLRALAQLDAAIDSDLPVLLVGETGTGKELFARALHEMGRRSRFPLVAVNCGAVPEALFEAEFFGHARGSFTGAERARRGLLGAAERGTLLLDEVGELPSLRQASLLRAIESKKYRAVGSDEEQSFDVRIVAATHRELGRAAEEGTFRRDLLFRLNVVEIRIPPLRDRESDIEQLAQHFLRAAGSSARLSTEALEALRSHDWPGNVRELEHHMQRLAGLATDEIGREALPREIRSAARRIGRHPTRIGPDQERREVERALAASRGNISHAAERLGVTRHGLKKRMVRLGMRKAAKS